MLTQHIIPLLPVQALGAVACNCRLLRRLVFGLGGAWQAAAALHLPPAGTLLGNCSRAEVQQGLQLHATAVGNMLAGHSTATVALEGPVGMCRSVSFAPDGDRIAVISSRWSGLCLGVFDARTGARLMSRKRIAPQRAGGQDPGYMQTCAFRWVEGGERVAGCWQWSAEREACHFFQVGACADAQPSLWRWQPGGELRCEQLCLSPCGAWAAVSLCDNSCSFVRTCIIDLRARATLIELPATQGSMAKLWRAGPVWSNNAMLAAKGSLISIRAKAWRPLPKVAAPVCSVEFSGDGQLMAIQSFHITDWPVYEVRSNIGFMDVASTRIKHWFSELSFLVFLGGGEWALMRKEDDPSSPVFQVWDLCTKALLCEPQQDLPSFDNWMHPVSLAHKKVIALIGIRGYVSGSPTSHMCFYDAHSGRATLQIACRAENSLRWNAGCSAWHPLATMVVTHTPESDAMLQVVHFV